MKVGYLADHPEFVPTLAQWHYAEWSHLRPGESLQGRTERLSSCCGHCQIPTVLIACTERTLLGSAMLVAHDMESRRDLSPWLAGVFVMPEQRRKGIGAALVKGIIDEAKALNVQKHYLYTPKCEAFYGRLGWSLVEHTNYKEMDVAIMSYTLRTD